MDAFEESIEVNLSAEECYEAWRRFSTFPGFMHNVKDVRPLKDNLWCWKLRGPQGDEHIWKAVLSDDIPEKRITWRPAEENKDAEVWLDIAFQRILSEITEITITLSVFPPDSESGNVFQNIYGINRQTIRKNLKEFKQAVEGSQAESRAPLS